MTNRSKAKGTSAETAVLRYLIDKAIPAHRKTLTGSADEGDITILSLRERDVTVEVKNEKKTTLSEYVDEAVRESANAKTRYGVAWHKRRGKSSPGEWYVSMTGEMFVKILHDLL